MTTANLLHGERKSVWLLFTLPRSLARMLFQRALVWVPICLVYAALVLAYGLGRQPVSRELVLGSAYCFFGLTLLTLISAGLGLHTVEPDALESEQASSRGGLQVLLLGVLLAAFGSGFYADAWLRVSLSVIVAAAAYGIWQDVSRRLPFLLEPDLQPPPGIGVSDALVCVLLIVVLEVFGARLAMSHLELRPWPAQGVAFVGAVALVAAGASLLFWRQGLRNVGSSLGLTWGGSVRGAVQQGLVWAVPAVVTAVVFLLLLRHWPWLGTWGNSAGLSRPNLERSTDTVILLLLTCVGAPLVEELLFRGMLYRSLRQSFSPRASALCAAVVLGAIHPGLACISVFLFSLFAAASFERSRSLVSPIVVHAAYNSTLFVVSALLGSS
jgi:ABC-2 type transport system permease protein